MTQDDINNGRLICVLRVAPITPAKFVIFRIQLGLTDPSGDLGECSTHRLASLRLPPLDLGAEGFVSVVDERLNQPATRADQISRSRIRTSVRSWPRLTSSRRVARNALRLRSRSRL